MELTEQQITTLANYINTDPAFAALPKNRDGAFEIVPVLDQLASPDFYVWRTSVTLDEIMQNGFDWVLVDNLAAGRARIWEWLFKNEGTIINPSKSNVRDGIGECWKGTAAMDAQRNVVLGHCKRKATRLEKLFAVGTGSLEVPATMAIEGSISPRYLSEVVMGWG
jgi:hypothetical protein